MKAFRGQLQNLSIGFSGDLGEVLASLGAISQILPATEAVSLIAVVPDPKMVPLLEASHQFIRVEVGTDADFIINPTPENGLKWGKLYAEQQTIASQRILHNTKLELPVSQFNYALTAASDFHEFLAGSGIIVDLPDPRTLGPRTPTSSQNVREWKNFFRKEYKWQVPEYLTVISAPLEDAYQISDVLQDYKSKSGKNLFQGLHYCVTDEETQEDPLLFASLVSLASYVVADGWLHMAAAGLSIPSIRLPGKNSEWHTVQGDRRTRTLNEGVGYTAIPQIFEQHLLSN